MIRKILLLATSRLLQKTRASSSYSSTDFLARKMQVFLLFSLCFIPSVYSQTTLLVRWNNSIISESPTDRDDRVLIYHDEIDVRTELISNRTGDGPGVLVCRHGYLPGDVEWLRPANDTPIQLNPVGDFRTIEYAPGITRVQLARTRSIPQDLASSEGLWTCNGGGLPHRHVAIYARGNGAVTTLVVTMQSSSFHSIPPTFTLVGNTTGGPPTTAMWLRNGEILVDGGPYGISTVANPDNDEDGRVSAHYQSTLVVTGMLPGVYEYRASNRATSGYKKDNITIEGGNTTDLIITQVGNYTVRVSWTPPAGPPSGGYRIVDTGNGLDRPAPLSPQEFELPPGDYNIHVTYTSLHFPGGSVGPQAITVLHVLQPRFDSVSQPTASTVILSWSQPPSSLIPNYYQLTLTRLTGNSQFCNSFADRRYERIDGRLSNFTNLEEFSSYNIRLTAYFHIEGGYNFSTFAEKGISTESSAPTGVPENVVHRTTSTSINATWDEIECIRQNGPNIRYEVDFQQLKGARTVAVVRGVNNAGTGDYTQPITMITDEDLPGPVSELEASLAISSYIVISWSSPQEPRGVIIAYEITYSVNGSDLVTVNTTGTTTFTLKLSPSTRVSNISVRAYTSIGPGPAVTSEGISTLSLVRNCEARIVNESAVVSWAKINATGYIVYYHFVSRRNRQNEMSMTVPGTESSAIIPACVLMSNREYQFQIAVTAEFRDKQIVGDRSMCYGVIISPISSAGSSKGREIGISVSVTVFLACTCVVAVLVGCAIHHSRSRQKMKTEPTDLMENVAYMQKKNDQLPQETELAESTLYDRVS